MRRDRWFIVPLLGLCWMNNYGICILSVLFVVSLTTTSYCISLLRYPEIHVVLRRPRSVSGILLLKRCSIEQ